MYQAEMPQHERRRKMTTTATTITVKDLYAKAHEAGMLAAEKCIPNPMGVVSIVDGKPQSLVIIEDGVCGFAWVNIRPARGAFVNYLKDLGIGSVDSYYGGYTIWVSDFGQSMTRKHEYAKAFARVLESWCITANAHARMD
jgi:hypothetical protein